MSVFKEFHIEKGPDGLRAVFNLGSLGTSQAGETRKMTITAPFDERSLGLRIEGLKDDCGDTSMEEKALKALRRAKILYGA